MTHVNANYNLTGEQQRLINMYITQYNQTNSHIEQLLDMLDEIRSNIFGIIDSSRRHRTSQPTSSNRHINTFINQLFNDRENNYVRYDYNSPINPSIYNLFSNTHSLHNPNNFINRNNYINSNSRNIRNNINNTMPNTFSSIFNNFFDSNVPINATNEQIQSASRAVRYGDISNPLSESCPISLERFNRDDIVRQIIHCGHIFCEEHFNRWFESNVRCPVCRYDIRNFTTNNNPSISNNQTQENSAQANPEETNTISNVNVVRNPESSEVEHISFDITNNELSNNILNGIASRLVESMLFPQSENQNNENDRLAFDPSNNILLFETIIRPNANR